MKYLSVLSLVTTLALSSLAFAAEAPQRMQVNLNSEQKAFVLGHMRTMLETLTVTQQLLLDGKPEDVAAQIEKMQLAHQQQRPVGMGMVIPPAFRAMSQSMQPHWQALAEPSDNSEQIQRHVVNLMQICNACHRSFSVL